MVDKDPQLPPNGQIPVPAQRIARAGTWRAVSDVIERADRQAKELEQRVRAKAKAGNDGLVLCRNDDELKTWLTEWSITQDDVAVQLNVVADQQSKLDARRSKGIHRIAASTQRFLAQVGELSSSYSGLVDTIGGAAGPYGEAASAGYRALSCLFLAATNKTGNEALVTSRLEEINRFFPQIHTLKAIYDEDTRIGILIALIHLDVVQFADKATQYFSNPWRRVLDIFIAPSFKTDTAYESMKTRLVELRSWARLNLHENAAKARQDTERLREDAASARGELRGLNDQLTEASRNLGITQSQVAQATTQLEEIRRVIRKQEEENQRQLLSALRQNLQIDEASINFNIEECSKSISKALETSHLNRRHEWQLAFMPRDRLEKDECFIAWSSGIRRFLLIGGVTHQDLMGCAWTTPAILELALEWHRESGGLLAFFTGSPRGYQHRSQQITFTNMLLGIVLEVARQVPSILQDDKVREVTKTLRKDCNDYWTLADINSLAKMIGLILAIASSERQLRLVIDRLDKVEEANEHYGDMLKCLSLLTAEAPNMRILVTWSVTDSRKKLEDQLEPLSDDVLYNIRLDSSYY